ncbi:type II toxin-antitoxin system RelE family toxin [Lacticaseibacillus suihuaensis]
MKPPYQIVFFDEALEAYEHLDGSQLVFVNKALVRLANLGMAAGQPLVGDLVGYRKLKNKRLGLRVVFGAAENGVVQVIDIVAIGKRDGKRVYRDAATRINDHR